MNIHYLEIVSPEADALCDQYAAVHGLAFGEPDPSLGNARTAKLDGGGMIGIRGPMRDTETPVIRPYLLVEDIEASVKTAAEAGAKVALPPMPIPGHGTCAIVIQGGIECGLWQV
ncbi:MAG: hydroxylase [Planctomycetota bacterium]